MGRADVNVWPSSPLISVSAQLVLKLAEPFS
jgi:hypothetical protein